MSDVIAGPRGKANMICESDIDMTSLYQYSWGQIGDEDLAVPLSVLYEYGKIALLHQGCGVEAPPLVWGVTTFTSEDKIWGLRVNWTKDLISGYRFVFVFKFELLPDIILADGNIIWRRSKDGARAGRVVADYVPAKSGPVRLDFIKDSAFRDPAQSDAGIRFGAFSACACCGPAELVDYDSYDRVMSLSVTEVDPLLTNRDFREIPLVESDMTPIADPGYPTMDVDIVHETLECYLPDCAHRIQAPKPEQIQQMIDTIPILEANGVSGMYLYHMTDELLEKLAQSKLRQFIVPTVSAGEWWMPSQETRYLLALGLDICNQLQRKMPDCHVYLWYPEVDDRESHLFNSPEFKGKFDLMSTGQSLIGYNDCNYNEYWLRDTMAMANRKWKNDIQQRVYDPSRSTAIFQSAYQFGALDFYRSGSDMTVCKAIFRACLNVTIAVGRGLHRAHHQRMGFDYDPWSWRFRMNHHPDEWSQGLRAYLHAGCSLLYHEGTLFCRDIDGQVKPTETGERFLESARYARRHPVVGEQIVKIAAMKGAGLLRGYEAHFTPQLPKDVNVPDWVPLQFSDYKLLDVFFPECGGYFSGKFERLMTGTPYGPLDIIPPDTGAEEMSGYDFVFVMGANGCDFEQLHAFTKYVENGGKLVIALGQLREQGIEPRKVINSDLSRLAGVAIDRSTESVEVVDAEVLHVFPEGSMLFHHKLGAGEVYFFTTGTLTALGDQEARRLLKKLGDESKSVYLSPSSDWVEIMLSRKGETVDLCLFNHCQIGFPSGNGPKGPVWRGEVRLDLQKLSLPSDIVLKSVVDGHRLVDVDSRLDGRYLVFYGEVDKFSEWVIGPAERIESDWYGCAFTLSQMTHK